MLEFCSVKISSVELTPLFCSPGDLAYSAAEWRDSAKDVLLFLCESDPVNVWISLLLTYLLVCSVCSNAANCVMKCIAWLYTGSHSMFSEFIHSLADTANQVYVGTFTFNKTDSKAWLDVVKGNQARLVVQLYVCLSQGKLCFSCLSHLLSRSAYQHQYINCLGRLVSFEITRYVSCTTWNRLSSIQEW